jgi:hypothetical protein
VGYTGVLPRRKLIKVLAAAPPRSLTLRLTRNVVPLTSFDRQSCTEIACFNASEYTTHDETPHGSIVTYNRFYCAERFRIINYQHESYNAEYLTLKGSNHDSQSEAFIVRHFKKLLYFLHEMYDDEFTGVILINCFSRFLLHTTVKKLNNYQ